MLKVLLSMETSINTHSQNYVYVQSPLTSSFYHLRTLSNKTYRSFQKKLII